MLTMSQNSESETVTGMNDSVVDVDGVNCSLVAPVFEEMSIFAIIVNHFTQKFKKKWDIWVITC